jgi:hypothetical protein
VRIRYLSRILMVGDPNNGRGDCRRRTGQWE